MNSANVDLFEDWYDYYPDFNKFTNKIPRPQPIDMVLDFFQGKKEGIFVDVGAYDGITWSNSLALEKYFDWKGICIEPIPLVYEKLRLIRSATCVNSAISNFDDSTEFIHVSGYAEMLSGISCTMNEAHLLRIEKEISQHGGTKSSIPLRVERLQSILDRELINQVDYLSIDVECGELNVLKGIDWGKTQIKLISCEVNEYSSGDGISQLLKSLNYKYLGRVCGDEFYAKDF